MAHHYKFIENDRIEEGTLLNSLNPFDYHVDRCGVDSFIKPEHSLIHTCWPGHGEDQDQNEDEDEDEDYEIETNFCSGNNETVKIFNQK